MSKPDRQRFTLTIEPAPGWPTGDGIHGPVYRMKRMLKAMLRTFGWRVIAATPTDAANPPAGDRDAVEPLILQDG